MQRWSFQRKYRILGELSDHTNEARAFAFLPPAWTLGAALGPMIGGFLADPAEQYPKYFGDNAFFLKYRYALPCFVGSIFPVLGIVGALLFLQEVSTMCWIFRLLSVNKTCKVTFLTPPRPCLSLSESMRDAMPRLMLPKLKKLLQACVLC